MLDILADLNEPQRAAVMHVDGPLLVLAGAGSGKTRVITRRLAWLIQQAPRAPSGGIAPWNVLAITFTNKAAGEMRQRVEQLGLPRGAMVCTFHSLCARLLREFAPQAGLPTGYTIYDRADQIKVVQAAMAKLELPSDRMPPGRVHSAISSAKNAMKTPDAFAAEAAEFFPRQVAKVYRQYELLLAQHNALDFDDLLLRMAFLLRDFPDVRKALGQRYRYILIDEYQDTNRAQYIIAHGIAMDHENICVTGDPDQSIYGWRGADIGNILEFEHDYPNAKVVRLEENYRSTTPILTTASALISHNVHRKEKSLWTSREGGQDVRVVYCDNEHAEADEIVLRMKQHHRAGKAYSDMAIFYRTNSLSRVLEENLIRAGVAYRIARGVEFYNRKEIKDLLAYLKVMSNPADDIGCQRIINVPPRGIGNTTVQRLKSFAVGEGISLLEACHRSERAGLGAAAGRKVKAFSQLMTALAADLERPVRQIMEEAIRQSGLEAHLRGSQDEEDADALANVAELVSTAEEFDTGEGGSLSDYLTQISLVSDVDHFAGGSGAVSLMTLHAAKGLEFPIVFIIGVEAGLLPFEHIEDSEGVSPRNRSRLEEERRLAFVGMTRARDELCLSCARYRMIRGRRSPQAASQFLNELGRECVAVDDRTTRTFSPPSTPSGRSRGGFYADVEERALIEASAGSYFTEKPEGPPLPPEYEHLKVGTRVHHPKFGFGKVLKLSQDWPETRADIQFDQWGLKKIVISKTHLEICSGNQ